MIENIVLFLFILLLITEIFKTKIVFDIFGYKIIIGGKDE